MSSRSPSKAPGAPGSPPHWTSSVKTGVGTALSAQCNVWFTIGEGTLTEIYFPEVDRPAIRDMRLIVTDGRDFIEEEPIDIPSKIELPHDGVPFYRLTNTSAAGRFRIEKEIVADPLRPVVLVRITFTPLVGGVADYDLYAIVRPRLGDEGRNNTARLGDYKSHQMLLAEREDLAAAVACSTGWKKRSVGYVGVSDGWQDLKKHKQLTWQYEEATHGNVALAGEIVLPEDGGAVTLALGFSRTVNDAAHMAQAGLLNGFERSRKHYIDQWEEWLNALTPPENRVKASRAIYRTSAAVLRIHEAKRFPGASIASLSIPWGTTHGDQDRGGYHLVWLRDMAMAAGALLAVSEHPQVRAMLVYLRATQEPDGRWPQNMWLDGMAYWTGLQLDEVAQAITMLDLAWREKAIDRDEIGGFWPLVRSAAAFLVRHGPVTEEDRWERNGGYSTSSIAAQIAGLLAAADLADLRGEHEIGAYFRDTADEWNDNIERWTYVRDTELSQRYGVDGYYVELAPANGDGTAALDSSLKIRNNPEGQDTFPVAEMVGANALQLVRTGVRAADSPEIINTVHVIDAVLKVDSPSGPIWRRYSHDGYGEHSDGSPFDGSGIGRAWPLLVGERAHFELAAGRASDAVSLLHTLEALANEGHLLPEQIWDAEDIPSRGLHFGRPSGSAMPLVWAHAEYLKLCRSLRDGKVFDMPGQTVDRYLVRGIKSRHATWRFDQKITSLSSGKLLRLQLVAAATVHWSADNWKSMQDTPTRDTGLGVHFADLPISHLPIGRRIEFTFFWTASATWEQKDFAVSIVKSLEDRLQASGEVLAFAGPDVFQSRAALDGERRLKATADPPIVNFESQRKS